MNYLKIHKNGTISPVSTGCLYCKKRLPIGDSKGKTFNKRCFSFLKSLNNGSWEVCPSGYSAIKQSKHCLCGCFISNKQFDKKKRNRAARMKKEEVDIILPIEAEKIFKMLDQDIFIDSYSAFIHDFSHSIGFLKTHLESCSIYKKHISSLSAVIKCYGEIIDCFNSYNDNYVSKPKLDDWLKNRENLDEVLDCYNRKAKSYLDLIDSIHPLFVKMETIVDLAFEETKGNHELDDHEKNKIYSMLYMKDLFNCQLEYASKSYLVNFGIDKNFLSPPKRVDVYKTLQKLVYLLKTPAKSKDLDGIFIKGKSHLTPSITEDVYLGFFILLENSLKYARQKTKVEVEVKDISKDTCRVVITNHSDYISRESLDKLTEIGFRGENSKNKESHGMGLAIAKVIFDQSNTCLSFGYENGVFYTTIVFSLSIS